MVFLGCSGQQNINVPTLETTVFPEYSGNIEPITEALVIPYPYLAYRFGITMDIEMYDKIKHNVSKLSMDIVNSFKRTQKEPDMIDITNDNAIGIGNNIAFVNCSYVFNTTTQTINSFACRSSNQQNNGTLEAVSKEPVQIAEAIFFNAVYKGIKTGTVLNKSKVAIPFSEKEVYVDEIVEGIGVFGTQKVIVAKINVDEDIKNLGHVVMKGYKLYDLKKLYPIFVKATSFTSNDKISMKVTAKSASVPLPSNIGNNKITIKPITNAPKGMEPPKEMYGVKYWE
jgi:hypothetical protein